MERNKKNLKERGITLVALIITIIVMLILVAVTVTVAVESNLIEVAETAGEKYKEGQTNDQIKANNVTVSGGQYATLEQYTCKHATFEEGVCTECGTTEIITFTVEGVEYSAPATYTWGQFMGDEKYKPEGWVLHDNYIYKSEADYASGQEIVLTMATNHGPNAVSGGGILGNCTAGESVYETVSLTKAHGEIFWDFKIPPQEDL